MWRLRLPKRRQRLSLQPPRWINGQSESRLTESTHFQRIAVRTFSYRLLLAGVAASFPSFLALSLFKQPPTASFRKGAFVECGRGPSSGCLSGRMLSKSVRRYRSLRLARSPFHSILFGKDWVIMFRAPLPIDPAYAPMPIRIQWITDVAPSCRQYASAIVVLSNLAMEGCPKRSALRFSATFPLACMPDAAPFQRRILSRRFHFVPHISATSSQSPG